MKSRLPHADVYTRLGTSKIHGIGVIAIKNIRKGTNIFPDVDDNIIWIQKRRISKVSAEMRKLYTDYCVLKEKQYGCPESFNRINISWYLNHSSKPNASANSLFHILTTRNIKKGEEITLDYRSFMDVKIPPKWR
jgi:SET domain-containing protein